MLGITGYASYLPTLRIKGEEFKQAWGTVGGGFKEKAVTDFDEDILTMGYEAAAQVLERAGIESKNIVQLILASTNYPYAEKVMSSSLSAMLGLPTQCFSSEHGNSTLAGSEALLEAWRCSFDDPQSQALAVIADAPHGPIQEAWENPLGAGAVALTLGRQGILCEVETAASYLHEYIGERFRPEGIKEIQELGIASYSRQANESVMLGSVKNLLGRSGLSVTDFHHVVLDQKNGRISTALGNKLGFSQEQLGRGMRFPQLGDTGVSSAFLGLCAVLDVAKPGERILLVTYGGGSASQAFSLMVARQIEEFRRTKVKQTPAKYIDYLTYLKLKRAIL